MNSKSVHNNNLFIAARVRPIKRDQVETDNNWEIEIVFGVATDPRSPVDQHLVPSS